MKKKFFIFLFLFLTENSQAKPEVYGDYNRGCIVSAKPLLEIGDGYQSVRRGRNMHFAHPNTLQVIESLGKKTKESGLGILLIGNLSKKNGGPLFEHSISHQNGLDFDVAYTLMQKPLTPQKRENFEFHSLLNPEQTQIEKKSWNDNIAKVLQWTAEQPEVERILVDPLIKKQLCETLPHEAWFKKIRPWFKHDNHFHVRLRCPTDSPECISQDPPPNEIGCSGEAYEWWFGEEARQMRLGKLKKPAPKKINTAPYPKICQEILKE